MDHIEIKRICDIYCMELAVLQRLYEKPSQKSVVLTLLVSTMIAILSLIWMYPMEVFLRSISPYGVIELELMWSVPGAQRILAAWGPVGIEKGLLVTYADYLYIAGYAFAIGMCNLLLLRACHRKCALSAIMKSILPLGVILPFVSAGFDVLENGFLIIVLLNPSRISPIHPFLASLCASMKFGVLFLGFVFFLFTLCLWSFKRE